ncbi:TetR/AcrR family transcriptional regulator [Paenibacillus sp. L3-i20]|uniref:TetR/AcrR family transcriptional regulator n=1 Tax=Paenibacillus sp. L3-i20 TaxID=2905833 RepID=UPI001EDF4839|nr:TetR/AcrR family transcriptional regulator [Paenibacillus sp. L3-i20]GKU75623.1 TetR family transcriptional regulator [Paenibacillus sp. L3-i20]
MTANRIKGIALSHFARFGYEGTSLANIAADVGIKKPSIYAHFKGKEELYFACLEEALNKDMLYFQQQAEQGQNIEFKQILHNILTGYAQRFGANEEAMFWLRSSYFPPDPFREQIVEKANHHITAIGKLLLPLFKDASDKAIIKNIEASTALEAYLCLFDGVMVELLYVGYERFELRLSASWEVFKRGLF